MHAPAATSAAEKNSTFCGNHPRKPDLLVGMYATANCASYATVTAEDQSQAKTSTASSSWMDSQADKGVEAHPSQANIESPTTQPTDEDGPKAKRRRTKADNTGGKGVKNRQQSEGNEPNKKKTRRDWGKDIIEISDTIFWMNEPPKHSPTAQGKSSMAT